MVGHTAATTQNSMVMWRNWRKYIHSFIW